MEFCFVPTSDFLPKILLGVVDLLTRWIIEDTKLEQRRRNKGIVHELDIRFSLGFQLRSQVLAMLVLTLSFACNSEPNWFEFETGFENVLKMNPSALK
ncbi:hypothetical protein GQ457_09G020600 [Hibiscus cannabinus]